MDNLTITFIATLVLAFIFLRWIISTDEDSVAESDSPSSNRSRRSAASQRSSNISRQPATRSRRQISPDMIEVVQALAPNLTVGQIRMDLERSGSVEATVERYLSQGSLPFPEDELTNTSTTSFSISAAGIQSTTVKSDEKSAYQKYVVENPSLDKKILLGSAAFTESKPGQLQKTVVGWKDTKEKRSINLQQKKAEMILRARKRMQDKIDKNQS